MPHLDQIEAQMVKLLSNKLFQRFVHVASQAIITKNVGQHPHISARQPAANGQPIMNLDLNLGRVKEREAVVSSEL